MYIYIYIHIYIYIYTERVIKVKKTITNKNYFDSPLYQFIVFTFI